MMPKGVGYPPPQPGGMFSGIGQPQPGQAMPPPQGGGKNATPPQMQPPVGGGAPPMATGGGIGGGQGGGRKNQPPPQMAGMQPPGQARGKNQPPPQMAAPPIQTMGAQPPVQQAPPGGRGLSAMLGRLRGMNAPR